MIDEATARAEERGVSAQQAAAEECRHREPRPAVNVPAGGGDIAFPPRQRSCRLVAAGWLRRRSEPEVSG